MSKIKLHHWIFIGMGVGLVLGLFLNWASYVPAGTKPSEAMINKNGEVFGYITWWLDLFGKDIFIGALKMIIAPLIFASIVSGITSLPSMEELGAIGWKTFAYYVVTTSVAVAVGLGAVLILRPGKTDASQFIRAEREQEIKKHTAEFNEKNPEVDVAQGAGKAQLLDFLAGKKGESLNAQGDTKWKRIQGTKGMTFGGLFKRDILKPILTNPINALANGNSLGIIFFAMLTGLACLAVRSHALSVVSFFQGLNEVMMKITMWIMAVAPIGIGCLIASLVGKFGIEVLQSVGSYCIAVIVGIAIHVAVLLFIVTVFGRMSPLFFLKGIRSAWVIAFSTTSSAATLPVTMKCVTENLKVSPKVANFALPVGATCNMDGTALYEGVAIIYLIQIYGNLTDVPIILGMGTTFIIFMTAVLASIGAAAVPSAGLITMAIVANAVGLPLYYIPLIFAVDHMLDQFRTSTNVLGDAVGTVVVNRWEAKSLGEEPPLAEPAPA